MNVRDVARRAGVSTATVSRTLNDPDKVGDRTRAQVMRVIEEMNYYPNLNARSLTPSTNKTLGVIVSNIGNQYFLDIFRAIESRAHRQGLEVLLANTDYCPDRLAASVRLMIGRRVAGLAVAVSEMQDDLLAELARAKIRVVISGVETPGLNFTNIRVNCRKGMEKILTYLCNLGHRRLAFVGHHAALASIGERVQTFSVSVAQTVPKLDSFTFADSDSIEGGRQATRDLLASGVRPTAIVCVNDLMALGVLKELRERGIGVPQQMSVTGFDNIAFSDVISPALTTVNIPRDTIGELMFASLVQAQERPSPREVVIDPELVLRESTGPVAASLTSFKS